MINGISFLPIRVRAVKTLLGNTSTDIPNPPRLSICPSVWQMRAS